MLDNRDQGAEQENGFLGERVSNVRRLQSVHHPDLQLRKLGWGLPVARALRSLVFIFKDLAVRVERFDGASFFGKK